MKRLLKIWSVLLLVMLVVGLWIPASSAQALYGQQQWATQPLPTASSSVLVNGSDVTDLAVTPSVIYAINGNAAAPLVGREVYKYTDAGSTCSTSLTVPSTVIARTLKAISSAPDNANVLAATDGATVGISSDGGSTWTQLTIAGTIWAGNTITDIAVGPARTGTLMGREYFISVANPAAANTAFGDVLIIGGANASWSSVSNSAAPNTAGSITGTHDYMSVLTTPNYLGDRSVAVLGISSPAGVPAAGTSVAQVINTATASTPYTAILTQDTFTTDYDAATTATGVIHGSIVLPTDFDATTSSGRRFYVGYTSSTVNGGNDVYRIDDNIAKALSAGYGVWSLAYSGTISAGTIFEGRYSAVDVRYSTDMTSGAPTWTSTQKFLQPSAAAFNPMIVVAAAPDYPSSKKVFAGSSGPESAFSLSTNGGLSFDQKAIIDTGDTTVNKITSVTVAGGNMYMATLSSSNIEAIWRSPTPTADNTWTRIYVELPGNGVAGAAGATLTLSAAPDFSTSSVIYAFDKLAGVNAYNIWRSADAGNTWNSRLPPAAQYVTVGQQDSNTMYWADNSANIYKSTNGGFTWTSAVSTGATAPITKIDIPKADMLIIAAKGGLAVSNDGGTTFTQYALDPTETYKELRDPGFATNNILYLADGASVTGKTYKYVLGTDTKPTDLLAPDGNGISDVSSLSMRNGVLYVLYTGHNSVTGLAAAWPTGGSLPPGLSTFAPGLRYDRTPHP
ncbi:MAG: hypothetical protein PHU08_04465, partial [Dehalococcoidales bacterium]|nr:hypothetical protein [Dehalococcoidales bacterium]